MVMAAALGVSVFGALAWVQYVRPASPQAPVAALPATAEPAGEAEAEPATPPQDTAAAEAAPAPAPLISAPPAPRAVAFDEVRREPDGMTVIAGRAEPGARIQILLDEAQISETRADGQGQFAAITMILPDGQGHVLSLVQIVQGAAIASADQIILAPQDPPVKTAAVAQDVQAVSDVAQDAPAPPAPDTVDTSEPAPVAPPDPPAPVDRVQAPVETAETPAPQIAQAPAAFDVPTSSDTPPPPALAGVPGVAPSARATPRATPPDAAHQDAAPQPEPTALVQITEVSPDLPAPEPAQPQGAENAAPLPVQAADINRQPQVPPTQAAAAPVPETQPDTGITAPNPAAEIAVLKATQDGVELLNVPHPETLDTVALDTISYSDSGDVQLSGRAQSAARHVQVYLDNSSVIRLEVDSAGRWRGDLPDVDEGVYTLRVDEVAEDGRVTSRVETPFKRESLAVLAEAAAQKDGPLRQITVQKGATLWAIARDRYGDGLLYVDVFEANADAIRDPDLIYPGQVFQLPE